MSHENENDMCLFDDNDGDYDDVVARYSQYKGKLQTR